jgi:hypothetical protein
LNTPKILLNVSVNSVTSFTSVASAFATGAGSLTLSKIAETVLISSIVSLS